MAIPTEMIGSIPRPQELIQALKAFELHELSAEALEAARQSALKETIERLEATGSPVLSDGEQRKSSFVTHVSFKLLSHPHSGIEGGNGLELNVGGFGNLGRNVRWT